LNEAGWSAKDSNGNWHASQRVNLGQFSSQRIGSEIGMAEKDKVADLAWRIFPNPYTRDVTIEFTVPEENSQVRLEILDSDGTVVKKVVDNPHAKGQWKYPVNNFEIYNDGMYFIRLKINESFMTHRILKEK